jgi:hypothetical protein
MTLTLLKNRLLKGYRELIGYTIAEVPGHPTVASPLWRAPTLHPLPVTQTEPKLQVYTKLVCGTPHAVSTVPSVTCPTSIQRKQVASPGPWRQQEGHHDPQCSEC